MSPQTAQLLVQEIIPRIRNSVSNSVPFVGADDHGELVQDGLTLAATLLTSAEARGKKVSAGNISYYVMKLLRQGRRSTGQSATDVMSPGTQITGRSRVTSLDAPLNCEVDGEETLCLHDALAAKTEDPAVAATRRLDWDTLLSFLDTMAREVLRCMLQGEDLTTLVPKLRRSRSSLQGDKMRLARLVREHLGEDVLRQVQEQPRWRDCVHASRERSACRYARQPA
jgi:hypothetical protein